MPGIIWNNFILAFVKRQIVQVRVGGWSELRRKLGLAKPILVRFPLTLLAIPLAFLAVVIIRMIRPFIIFRFHRIASNRIGHFAGNLELYLCELDAGINVPNGKFVDLWYHSCPPCNKQLDTMLRRVLNIGPMWLLSMVRFFNNKIPGGSIHNIGDNTSYDRDVNNLLDQSNPHLKFLHEEEKQGQAGLLALGIPFGAPFVCLMVRDSAYLSDQSLKANAKVDWSYHDYRNCDIQNYILAAQELTRRGYYVVRMGALVKDPINISHPMIIDYAANGGRSDFMDIYLGAKCAFCISNGTGIDAIPYIFRRSTVYVDMVSIGCSFTFCNGFLATTKKHWLRNENRYMTLPEIFESGADYFTRTSEYHAKGIDLHESSPEEIAEVVLEMESRLKGVWQTTKEDENLQLRFWELFNRKPGERHMHGDIRLRIGAYFLRSNKASLLA